MLSIGQNLDSAILVGLGLYKALFAGPSFLVFCKHSSFNTRFFFDLPCKSCSGRNAQLSSPRIVKSPV